jgi:hypothetical protein
VESIPRLVPQIEVSLSEDTHFQFQRMVDEEFVTEEQAIEELLTAGLEAYQNGPAEEETREGYSQGAEDNLFDTSSEDPGQGDI